MGLKESGLRGSLRNVSVGINAIPDTEAIKYRYNGEEGLTDSEWMDQAENEDLFFENDPDVGEDSVTFDGNDQNARHEQSVPVSMPFEIWLVAEMSSEEDGNIFGGRESSGTFTTTFSVNDGNWGMFHGESISGSSVDTNLNIFRTVWDSNDSALEINESVDVTGDVGSRDWNEFFVIADNERRDNPKDLTAYETIVYENRDDDRATDVYSYLNRWL